MNSITENRLNPIKCIRKNFWKFKCDCGSEKIINSKDVKSGKIKSCGCLRKELLIKRKLRHGFCGTRVYKIFIGMHTRCSNKKAQSYSRYGGRGISICKEWGSFENFIKDMGQPPSNKHSLDRINSDGNYEPNNCRWSTQKEQCNNQKRNKVISFSGLTMNLGEWASFLGIKRSTLGNRLNNGWTISKALTTRVK